jgi:hypothetical protein
MESTNVGLKFQSDDDILDFIFNPVNVEKSTSESLKII